MCIFVSVRVINCLCVRMCQCVYVRMCACVNQNHICVCVCVCVCASIYEFVFVRVFVPVCVLVCLRGGCVGSLPAGWQNKTVLANTHTHTRQSTNRYKPSKDPPSSSPAILAPTLNQSTSTILALKTTYHIIPRTQYHPHRSSPANTISTHHFTHHIN